jgi:hypothetical protein
MIAVLPLILGPPLLFHASGVGVHHVPTTPRDWSVMDAVLRLSFE